jgi:D-3-phosphoglycerate dehydrogenase / 2-oxoglutarate reductase
MTYFVAVTDSPAGDDLSIERGVLAGLRVERVLGHGPEELAAGLQRADAVLCMHAPMTATVIAMLHRCRVIARFGTGLDNIDRQAAVAAGIPVVGVPDYCTEEVANHTLALLLTWNRKILQYDRFVRELRWNERPQTTGNWGSGPLTRLSGQTLGIAGFGHIGQAVASRAAAFGMRVLAYTRRSEPEAAGRLGVTLVDRSKLLHESDYLCLHLPLTPETSHFIDGQTIESMKPGAVLINTARGGLVDEDALVAALRSGRLGGALLDVYEQAPLPPEHPLRALPNVVFTPHVSFYSEESLRELRYRAAKAVLSYLVPDKEKT